MSKTTTLRTLQAFSYEFDDREVFVAPGYSVHLTRAIDAFRKTDACNNLVKANLLELDAKTGTTQEEYRAKARKEQREAAQVGPTTLVEVIPSAQQSKFTLRQADLTVLPETYGSFAEAQKAMLEHNTRQWEEWEAKQEPAPKAKAS